MMKPADIFNVTLIALLLTLFVFGISGCGSGDETALDNQPDPDVTGQANINPPPTEEPVEPVAEEEEFTPTEERPLAPPAPDAVGIDSVPDGEYALVVSVGGLAPPEPISDNMSLDVRNGLDFQLSIVNNMDHRLVIGFRTTRKVDIVFTDTENGSVYFWPTTREYRDYPHELSVDVSDVWSHELTALFGAEENRVPPGTYDVEVIITGNPELKVEVSEMEINLR